LSFTQLVTRPEHRRRQFLRDGALEAQAAGVAEDCVAVTRQVVAEADAAALAIGGDDLGGALRSQRRILRSAIEMERSRHRGRGRLARLQGVDERGEAGDAGSSAPRFPRR
jgi:hypothetical protein